MRALTVEELGFVSGGDGPVIVTGQRRAPLPSGNWTVIYCDGECGNFVLDKFAEFEQFARETAEAVCSPDGRVATVVAANVVGKEVGKVVGKTIGGIAGRAGGTVGGGAVGTAVGGPGFGTVVGGAVGGQVGGKMGATVGSAFGDKHGGTIAAGGAGLALVNLCPEE